MSASSRGIYTRLLPWAALSLMVVFFFLQVAARNRVAARAQTLHERVQELEAAGGATPGARMSGAATDEQAGAWHLRAAYAEAAQRAEAARARVLELTTHLERAEAVRAAQAARAEALAAERTAAAQGATRQNELIAEENEALARESSALIAQRDMLLEEVASAEQALTRERDTAFGARMAWAVQREELEAQASRAQAEAERARAEARALRAMLADVQAQMERMLVQARENRARIASLQQAPRAKPATARDHAEHWLRVVGDDPDRSTLARRRLDATFAALREAWMAESQDTRAARADAYVALLNTMPRSEESLATARRLTTIGMVPDDVLARMVAALATTHLTDAHSWTTLLLRGGPAVRAVVLQRLRRDGARWNEPEREALGRALRTRLDDRDAGRRRDAAWGVGALAHEGAATRLVRLLGDDDADVRKAAAWALTRLKRSPATVDPLKTHVKALLDSPRIDERGEAIWLAQWVLGQPQNTSWLELTDAQIRRVADRLRRRLDQ